MQGFVYVLSNPSMPGLVKIGRTEHDPSERVSELSGETGIPTPFKLEFSYFSADIEDLEQILHARLAPHRVSPNREFFRLPVADIAAVVQEVKTAIHESSMTSFVDRLMTLTDDELCQIIDRVLMRRRAVRAYVRRQ